MSKVHRVTEKEEKSGKEYKIDFQVCHYYQDTGVCPFGATCRFPHIAKRRRHSDENERHDVKRKKSRFHSPSPKKTDKHTKEDDKKIKSAPSKRDPEAEGRDKKNSRHFDEIDERGLEQKKAELRRELQQLPRSSESQTGSKKSVDRANDSTSSTQHGPSVKVDPTQPSESSKKKPKKDKKKKEKVKTLLLGGSKKLSTTTQSVNSATASNVQEGDKKKAKDSIDMFKEPTPDLSSVTSSKHNKKLSNNDNTSHSQSVVGKMSKLISKHFPGDKSNKSDEKEKKELKTKSKHKKANKQEDSSSEESGSEGDKQHKGLAKKKKMKKKKHDPEDVEKKKKKKQKEESNVDETSVKNDKKVKLKKKKSDELGKNKKKAKSHHRSRDQSSSGEDDATQKCSERKDDSKSPRANLERTKSPRKRSPEAGLTRSRSPKGKFYDKSDQLASSQNRSRDSSHSRFDKADLETSTGRPVSHDRYRRPPDSSQDIFEHFETISDLPPRHQDLPSRIRDIPGTDSRIRPPEFIRPERMIIMDHNLPLRPDGYRSGRLVDDQFSRKSNGSQREDSRMWRSPGRDDDRRSDRKNNSELKSRDRSRSASGNSDNERSRDSYSKKNSRSDSQKVKDKSDADFDKISVKDERKVKDDERYERNRKYDRDPNKDYSREKGSTKDPDTSDRSRERYRTKDVQSDDPRGKDRQEVESRYSDARDRDHRDSSNSYQRNRTQYDRSRQYDRSKIRGSDRRDHGRRYDGSKVRNKSRDGRKSDESDDGRDWSSKKSDSDDGKGPDVYRVISETGEAISDGSLEDDDNEVPPSHSGDKDVKGTDDRYTRRTEHRDSPRHYSRSRGRYGDYNDGRHSYSSYRNGNRDYYRSNGYSQQQRGNSKEKPAGIQENTKESNDLCNSVDFEAISDDEVLGDWDDDEKSSNGALDIDWESLMTDTKPAVTNAGSTLQRFSAASVFSRIGISRAYAGEELFKKIENLCSTSNMKDTTLSTEKSSEPKLDVKSDESALNQTMEAEPTKSLTSKGSFSKGEGSEGMECKATVAINENTRLESTNYVKEATVTTKPFKFHHDIAAFHAATVKQLQARADLFSCIGLNRGPLYARRDLDIRRQLCKMDLIDIEV